MIEKEGKDLVVGGKIIKAELKTVFENSQPIPESPFTLFAALTTVLSSKFWLWANDRPEDLRPFNFMVFRGPAVFLKAYRFLRLITCLILFSLLRPTF